MTDEKVQELEEKYIGRDWAMHWSVAQTVAARKMAREAYQAGYLAGEKAELEEAAKWIKCSEREPDEEGRYLIQYRQHGQVRIFIGDYIPREGWLCHMVDMEVLQWQKIVSPAAISDCATSDVEAARNTSKLAAKKEKA